MSLLKKLRDELVGLDIEVPTLSGERRRYVSLDNAASTPTFRPIMEKVNEFLGYYANVHRGTGFKSQLSSWAYDEAREVVARFVKADPAHQTVIFTRNTTESMNKLARLYPFRPGHVVLTTTMEHHSNDLPWRRRTRVVYVGMRDDGSLDLDDYRRKLAEYRGRIDLVAVTGASNVSGWLNPAHLLARLAHESGARFVLDAAQLAAHRPIDMKPADDPEHIDFLALSAHKMYAPFGAGALVVERKPLLDVEPDQVGGGMVDVVSLDGAWWRGLPEREEAGTPDIVGVVALAAAIRMLERIGWDAIVEHEQELTRYMLKKLATIPGVRIYGQSDPAGVSDRLGAISFNLADLHHALVAAVLSYEGGIAVRCGCFCAHPYMLCLLKVPPDEAEHVRKEIIAHDRSRIPGAVRASVGIYNDESDIDALCNCLERIAAGSYSGQYTMCKETGNYMPVGADCFDFEHHFDLAPRLPE
ncbi:MAG: aminotransferase class V-fold PLP-dependent enzyme [candidate division WOR-3 bacterium]|nr:aminotransferase class V-fold PLP-dependent enzyme [candidate division WOR-3 bacterium]